MRALPRLTHWVTEQPTPPSDDVDRGQAARLGRTGGMNREATSGAEGADVTVGIPTWNRSDLLGKAIASVLQQTYRRFTVVVSDNASDDDTASLVSSFRDPRVVYRPLERNIGRHANFNRLIELAETEFVVLLGDDDELRPEHLALTVDALKRWPTAGVAHTGCVIVDRHDKTLVPHARLMKTKESTRFESGTQFLERGMRAGWMMCMSSATFRKAALVDGGGVRPEDGLIDDFALLMRIATKWDFAYVNQPLAIMRAHDEASSSAQGSFTPGGYRQARSQPDVLYEQRRRFLDEAELPEMQARRLARIAERTHRRDVVGHLSSRATTGDGVGVMFRALGSELRRDHRMGLDPVTWRFVVGQLGARRLRDGARRALEPARHRQ
jgi:glycosyltransferase involved in cell wall biosynthesis